MKIEPGHLRVLADYEKLYRDNGGVVPPAMVRDALFAVVSTLIWNGERVDPLVDVGRASAPAVGPVNPAPDYNSVVQATNMTRAETITKARGVVHAIKSSSVSFGSESSHPVILVDRKLWDDLCRVLGEG